MKPAPFDYERPASLGDAVALLGTGERVAKCLAGGQSLGPMLNLRLVQPDLLVDITRIPELTRVEENGDWLLLGACTTHAAIEDRRVPDVTGGVLPAVAAGIAYRAVRTRGTIGGSLAHADPAAELPALSVALDAQFTLAREGSERVVNAADFFVTFFTTAKEQEEVLTEVRIPPLGPGWGWGFQEVSRRN
ncbi:MAG: FAD binding domain-containing protein, partial [Proteobacteria bacterium]|nr:FAD binding domain-containing protein [Pseudomonadota bacterium]